MDDTLISAPSDPGHLASLACKPVPEAAFATRALLKEALIEWRMAELIDDSTLVATELVSNAIRSGDDIGVELFPVTAGGARFLRIEVFDSGPEPPQLRDGDLLDESGRGLQLVAAFAANWGHRIATNGKIVWAVIGPVHSTE